MGKKTVFVHISFSYTSFPTHALLHIKALNQYRAPSMDDPVQHPHNLHQSSLPNYADKPISAVSPVVEKSFTKHKKTLAKLIKDCLETNERYKILKGRVGASDAEFEQEMEGWQREAVSLTNNILSTQAEWLKSQPLPSATNESLTSFNAATTRLKEKISELHRRLDTFSVTYSQNETACPVSQPIEKGEGAGESSCPNNKLVGAGTAKLQELELRMQQLSCALIESQAEILAISERQESLVESMERMTEAWERLTLNVPQERCDSSSGTRAGPWFATRKTPTSHLRGRRVFVPRP